jgi:hypothetical protein
MSLSNPKLTNPATKFIEWKGGKGIFQYYDKETEQIVELKIPFYFIVLDQLNTVTGFNERLGCGIYSNEVRNTKREILHVKSFKSGVQIDGYWNDISEKVGAVGGKYCKSVYAMLIKGKDEFEMVCFKLSGSAFSGNGEEKTKSGWINTRFDFLKYGVQVKATLSGKKGSTEFIAPIFDLCNVKETSVWGVATAMDRKLQTYLDQYFSKEEEVTDKEPEVIPDPDYGDLPESETQPDPNFLEKHKQEMTESLDPGKYPDDLPF